MTITLITPLTVFIYFSKWYLFPLKYQFVFMCMKSTTYLDVFVPPTKLDLRYPLYGAPYLRDC